MPNLGIIVGNTYKLEYEIGKGSFGNVFEATNLKSNSKVAIKVE